MTDRVLYALIGSVVGWIAQGLCWAYWLWWHRKQREGDMTTELNTQTRPLMARMERLLARQLADNAGDGELYWEDEEQIRELWWDIVRWLGENKPDNSDSA